MLKSLIVAGHLIGVFFLSFVFSDEITITDTFPESLQVGETYMVTVSITKNDVTGFAKYQIDAPRGVVIKPVDLSSASFTFKDGKAKFIWMNLPTASTFDITYEITVEDGEIGSEKEVNSRLSYLVDNARKIHQGPNHVLKISGADGAVATHSTTSSEITATRKITPEGDNKYLVEISINKLGVKGFAKIQDVIPDAFVATEVMNSEAIFTQTDAKVKLVWFDIPKNMTLNVSYLLEAPSGFSGNAEIVGKFHYMAGSDLKKVPIPNQTIQIGGDIASTENSNSTESTTEESSSMDTNTAEEVTNPATKVVDEVVNGTDEMTAKAEDTAEDAAEMSTKMDEVETSSSEVSSSVDNATSMTNEQTGDNANEALENTEETSSNFLDNFISSQNSSDETSEIAEEVPNNVDESMSSTTEEVSTGEINVTPDSNTSTLDSNPEDATSNSADVSGNSVVNDVVSNTSMTENNENNSISETVSQSTTTVEQVAETINETTTEVGEVAETNTPSTGTNNRSSVDDLLSSTPSNRSNTSEVDETTSTVNQSAESAAAIIDEGFSNINESKVTPNMPTTKNEEELSSTTTSTVTPDMTTAVAEPESTMVATPTYEKEEVVAEANNFDEISNFSAPESGINYRVQIMAAKKVVGKEYLRKRHNFESNFNIENHEGWIKYTSGTFEEYKSARDQRNVIREEYNFNGPFVSAYNDGVRITVQEALMISKQQWYN